MSITYTLVTQHGPERKVRRRRFANYDDAVTFADTHNPDDEPTTCPQIDQRFIDDQRYERGCYWFGNRYGVILKIITKSNEETTP